MMSDIRFYWRLVLRRLPILIPIVILCSALGLLQALRLPATYQTEARLLVEGAVVEDDTRNNNNTGSVDEEIQIIREQLLTRSNLLDIADEFNVFENYSEMSPDLIVDLMQASTSIQNRGGRNQATVITVSFEARSGQIAADVVNEYVSRILDASVRRRTEFDEDNLDFYEQEVARLSDDLARRSAAISVFKTENADALPEDQQFRLTRQATLQERITSAQRLLSSLSERRAGIIEIYEQTGQITDSGTVLSDDQRQLRDLERELAQALTIYSESAPRIITLRRRIDQLREIVSATGNPDAPATTGQAVLNAQLSAIDSEIADQASIVAEAEAELAELQDAISRTPSVAITIETMERDYENTRGLYDRAADNLQEARIALRITETNRGERIEVVEAAAVPRYPSSPNRKLIAFFGGVAGLGLAGGLFVLLELLNRTVRRPVEVTRALGIEPLVTVPYIETRSERIRRHMMRAAALILVVVGLPAALWAVDSYYMPLDQLAEQVLGSLGLA